MFNLEKVQQDWALCGASAACSVLSVFWKPQRGIGAAFLVLQLGVANRNDGSAIQTVPNLDVAGATCGHQDQGLPV